ncbi:MAG: peptidylprolyl isomerase [Anaerolineaceae bacterium]|nr:peptidylprolyl isomerase [Anaerolineaceae bacterium]
MKLKNEGRLLVVSCSLLFLLSACFGGKNKENGEIILETEIPTPTEAPMAARVNGDGILLTEYEAELKRYQAGIETLGESYDPQLAKREVLDDLIVQTLFAQAAAEQGYTVEDADLHEKIAGYIESLGGAEKLEKWKSDNFYDDESFRTAVERDMAVIWMRNFLIAQLPQTAEQVHARQILVKSENEALGVLRQLEVGTPFKDLAYQYDPLTGGELGWFPRGYLLQPDVEEAAFALQPGQYSGIISTDFGFHIVEVIERDAEKQLSQDARLFLQRRSLEEWLEEKRAQSTIEILVP